MKCNLKASSIIYRFKFYSLIFIFVIQLIHFSHNLLASEFPKGSDLSAIRKEIDNPHEFSFVLSNERNNQSLKIPLQLNRGGAYLGLGPEQNYAYIYHSQPDHAFLYDRGAVQVLTHTILQVGIKNSDSPKELMNFLSPFSSSLISKDENLRNFENSISKIKKEFPNKEEHDILIDHFKSLCNVNEKGYKKEHDGFNITNWGFNIQDQFHQTYGSKLNERLCNGNGCEPTIFNNNEMFQYIKKLYMENRIHLYFGNHGDPALFESISEKAKNLNTKFKNIYLSNSHEGLKKGPNYYPRTLIENLNILPLDSNATIYLSSTPFYSSDAGFEFYGLNDCHYLKNDQAQRITELHHNNGFPNTEVHQVLKAGLRDWQFISLPVKSLQEGFKKYYVPTYLESFTGQLNTYPLFKSFINVLSSIKK